jgi:hypothetical protein
MVGELLEHQVLGTIQKDLGPKTEAVAKAMTLYNSDPTWRRAQ